MMKTWIITLYNTPNKQILKEVVAGSKQDAQLRALILTCIYPDSTYAII